MLALRWEGTPGIWIEANCFAQSVLETTSPTELRVTGELDLSRDEDSVMSLAVAGRQGKTINVFAGINSSPESIDKGKNEHLRSVAVRGTKVTEEARHHLFANPAGDVYQRLLRVSPTLGAAGSGFGKDPQIGLFNISGSKGGKLVKRGTVELPRDAEDLDIIQLADGSHLLTYCFKYELHLMRIDKEDSEPRLIYSIPADEPNRPAFRSARFLGPEFILAVANMPGRSGVAIHGYRLAKAGQEKARLAVSAKISRKIAATAIAVTNLTSPTRSSSGGVASLGDTQFVIAIAGHDSSISLYSLIHVASPAVNLLTKLYPLNTLKAVHGEDNITGLAFSTFSPPSTKAAASEPQHVKLVSISLQKTVALHSIPLKKFVDPAPRSKNAPPRPVRYITAATATAPTTARRAIILFSFVALLLALVGQSVVEVLGQGHPFIQRYVPGVIRPIVPRAAAPPIVHEHAAPIVAEAEVASILKDDFLSKVAGAGQDPSETLVLYAETPTPAAEDGSAAQPAADIKVEVHNEEVHGPGKTWEELPESQQHAWKARLHDAGAWTQQMGESVFKGILFGELGGAIGHAVAG